MSQKYINARNVYVDLAKNSIPSEFAALGPDHYIATRGLSNKINADPVIGDKQWWTCAMGMQGFTGQNLRTQRTHPQGDLYFWLGRKHKSHFLVPPFRENPYLGWTPSLVTEILFNNTPNIHTLWDKIKNIYVKKGVNTFFYQELAFIRAWSLGVHLLVSAVPIFSPVVYTKGFLDERHSPQGEPLGTTPLILKTYLKNSEVPLLNFVEQYYHDFIKIMIDHGCIEDDLFILSQMKPELVMTLIGRAPGRQYWRPLEGSPYQEAPWPSWFKWAYEPLELGENHPIPRFDIFEDESQIPDLDVSKAIENFFSSPGQLLLSTDDFSWQNFNPFNPFLVPFGDFKVTAVIVGHYATRGSPWLIAYTNPGVDNLVVRCVQRFVPQVDPTVPEKTLMSIDWRNNRGWVNTEIRNGPKSGNLTLNHLLWSKKISQSEAVEWVTPIMDVSQRAETTLRDIYFNNLSEAVSENTSKVQKLAIKNSDAINKKRMENFFISKLDFPKWGSLINITLLSKKNK